MKISSHAPIPPTRRSHVYRHCWLYSFDGSNGSRNRLWKKELQNLATEMSLEIHVCHFPPGTSKWNKIEHRMFSYITKNWRAKPLESLEAIVNLIAYESNVFLTALLQL